MEWKELAEEVINYMEVVASVTFHEGEYDFFVDPDRFGMRVYTFTGTQRVYIGGFFVDKRGLFRTSTNYESRYDSSALSTLIHFQNCAKEAYDLYVERGGRVSP